MKLLLRLYFFSVVIMTFSNPANQFTEIFGKLSIFVENGHPGVTRSIYNGLRKLQINFNINPLYSEIGSVIFCLDGINKLREAIQLKRMNRIKRLIVGPNMVGRMSDENYIILSPEIDIYLTPSQWNWIGNLQDAPSLEKNMLIWPVGVDTDFWKCENHRLQQTSPHVLVYWKTEPETFCVAIENLLKKYNWQPIRIKYGSYIRDDYKKCLSKVNFAVFISRSESQGIALAECWAMNVPTLVWNPGELFTYNRWYDPVSASPYLTDATGKDWKELYQLEELLKAFKLIRYRFEPRQWVLNNMTDEICITKLFEIICNS